MFLEAIILGAAIWIAIEIFDTSSQPKAGLPRIGINPRSSVLRTWYARWKWHNHGHEEVIRAYEQVWVANIWPLRGNLLITS